MREPLSRFSGFPVAACTHCPSLHALRLGFGGGLGSGSPPQDVLSSHSTPERQSLFESHRQRRWLTHWSYCASAMPGQFSSLHSASARGGLVWEGYLAPAPSVKCCRVSTVTCYTFSGKLSRVGKLYALQTVVCGCTAHAAQGQGAHRRSSYDFNCRGAGRGRQCPGGALSAQWIGNSNGIFARCLWERTPGAPPTWTPHHILVPLLSSSSLLKYFACILLICAV